MGREEPLGDVELQAFGCAIRASLDRNEPDVTTATRIQVPGNKERPTERAYPFHLSTPTLAENVGKPILCVSGIRSHNPFYTKQKLAEGVEIFVLDGGVLRPTGYVIALAGSEDSPEGQFFTVQLKSVVTWVIRAVRERFHR